MMSCRKKEGSAVVVGWDEEGRLVKDCIILQVLKVAQQPKCSGSGFS